MPMATATSKPPKKSVPSDIQVGIESTGPQTIRAPRTIRAKPPRSAPMGANLAPGDAVMDQTVADLWRKPILISECPHGSRHERANWNPRLDPNVRMS